MKENFENLGFEIDEILHLTGKQALICLQKEAILLDVREDFEVAIKDFGIVNTLWCPFSDFDRLLITLPKAKAMIVADCVGIHSKDATRKLLNAGFTKVANLAGGIAEWEKDGLPMKKDIESMSGQCPCMIKSRPS
jgi:rhodanese-related sulfurtransferase